MKKLLMLCACFAAAACAKDKPEGPPMPPKTIELKYNASVSAEKDLILHFISVNDSRCPAGTTCAWEGNAEIIVELTGFGNAAAVLNTNPQFEQSYHYNDHTITLKELKPYPESGQTVDVNSYVAVLTVEKK
jgi:hypothetical protein